MNYILVIASAFILLVSCTSSRMHSDPDMRNPAALSDPTAVIAAIKAAGGAATLKKDGTLWDLNDKDLIDDSPDALTVWSLREMVDQDVSKVDDIFQNHAVSISQLPQGYSAGAGGNIFGKILASKVEALTAALWRGKIFCVDAGDGWSTHGYNRIASSFNPLVTNVKPIISQAAFTSMLVLPTNKRLTFDANAKSNVVILNYAHPVTSSIQNDASAYDGLLEDRLAQLGGEVYDAMVAVKGKYGPLFIGKTWEGTYDVNGQFTPFTDRKVAWFFLDFNDGALEDQVGKYWPKGQHELLSVVDTSCPKVPHWTAAP